MQTGFKVDLGLPPWLDPLAKKALGLRQLESIYKKVKQENLTAGQFCRRVLVELKVTFELPRPRVLELRKLQMTGNPLIFVANHPLGAIEALILICMLEEISPEFKILGNAILENIPELRGNLIPVNILGKQSDLEKNLSPMRKVLEYLSTGGVLGMFPAGQVSSFEKWSSKKATDIAWSKHLGRLVKVSHATVVPVFFEGRNSLLFQYLGLALPELRIALLAREMLNYKNSVEFQVGQPVTPERLINHGDAREITFYLRRLCDGLSKNNDEPAALKEIVPGINPSVILKEIELLRENGKLVLEKGQFEAFIFNHSAAPSIVEELGRLRELTFRGVGEGTGQSLDLDRFDETYLHLVLWDKKASALVGSYRLALVDRILPRYGLEGLYTSTLFQWEPRFLNQHMNSIELGRSFVVEEYQKNFWSLHLLWLALGRFIVENPKYRYLFGPVSISGTFPTQTQSILVRFLKDNHSRADQPVVRAKKEINLPEISAPISSLREALALIQKTIDPEFKIPPLLKHYSSLGGEVLGFNVDSLFQDSVDCLFFLDLEKTDPLILKRYIHGNRKSFETADNEVSL